MPPWGRGASLSIEELNINLIQSAERNDLVGMAKWIKEGADPYHQRITQIHEGDGVYSTVRQNALEIAGIPATLKAYLEAGKTSQVRSLFRKFKINPNRPLSEKHPYNRTPLMYAAAKGKLHTAKMLCTQFGADILSHIDSRTALHCAAEAKQEAFMVWLIEEGANPEHNLITRMSTQRAGSWEVRQNALELGGISRKVSNAIVKGNVKVLRRLAKRFYIDLNEAISINNVPKTAGRLTPLLLASKHGKLNIVRELVENETISADVTAKSEGRQAIHDAAEYAAKNDNLAVMAYLTSKGANPYSTRAIPATQYATKKIKNAFELANVTVDEFWEFYKNEGYAEAPNAKPLPKQRSRRKAPKRLLTPFKGHNPKSPTLFIFDPDKMMKTNRSFTISGMAKLKRQYRVWTNRDIAIGGSVWDALAAAAAEADYVVILGDLKSVDQGWAGEIKRARLAERFEKHNTAAVIQNPDPSCLDDREDLTENFSSVKVVRKLYKRRGVLDPAIEEAIKEMKASRPSVELSG